MIRRINRIGKKLFLALLGIIAVIGVGIIWVGIGEIYILDSIIIVNDKVDVDVFYDALRDGVKFLSRAAITGNTSAPKSPSSADGQGMKVYCKATEWGKIISLYAIVNETPSKRIMQGFNKICLGFQKTIEERIESKYNETMRTIFREADKRVEILAKLLKNTHIYYEDNIAYIYGKHKMISDMYKAETETLEHQKNVVASLAAVLNQTGKSPFATNNHGDDDIDRLDKYYGVDNVSPTIWDRYPILKNQIKWAVILHKKRKSEADLEWIRWVSQPETWKRAEAVGFLTNSLDKSVNEVLHSFRTIEQNYDIVKLKKPFIVSKDEATLNINNITKKVKVLITALLIIILILLAIGYFTALYLFRMRGFEGNNVMRIEENRV